MKTRIGSYSSVVSILLLLGFLLLMCNSCSFLADLKGEETDGTEEASTPADTADAAPEESSSEEATRIPVSTKDQSTTETKPVSSNTTEPTPTPPPTPPTPDTDGTAASGGIGEVMPWDGENGLQ
ncbi:MAG: hypothetical protein IKC59_04815 [Clostridia bacterium]|nr:hypothetical protein [Clostridia bacterium]